MPSAEESAAGEASERLVCAVLAAQVAALRDRIGDGATVELLWQASDAVAEVVGLVTAQATPDAARAGPRETVATATARIGASLTNLAFLQAQRMDLARQMADCVAIALDRLAKAPAPAGARLGLDELAALYVSEEQRHLHAAVVSRFPTPDPPGAAPPNHQGTPR